MLATAAHQVVIKSSETIHKVKATIQQFQNNRLSTELLKEDTINKTFYFIQDWAIERGLEPLIKNPSDLFQVEVSFLQTSWKHVKYFCSYTTSAARKYFTIDPIAKHERTQVCKVRTV